MMGQKRRKCGDLTAWDAGSAAADGRGNEGRVTQSGIPHPDGGGPDFGRMIEALRLAQERITAASPP